VVEECVEHYPYRLAAGHDAEDIKCHREIEGCGTGEADSEGAENGKDERGQNLKRDLKKRIGQEECGKWVCAILILVVEDL
jgi:hypothetical protein